MVDPINGNNNQNNRKKWLHGLIALALAALILGGGYWYFFLYNRVTTDNAYVMADSAMISSRIPGTILEVLVDNDTAVKAEQTLITLDPRDYQLAVDEAQAALARIEAEIKAMGVTISQSDIQTAAQQDSAESGVGEAQDRVREGEHKLEALKQQRIAALADLTIARRDFERYDRLYKQQAIALQQWDRAKTLLDKATAQLNGIDAEINAVQASVAAARQAEERSRAQWSSAKGGRYSVDILRQQFAALRAKREEVNAQLQEARLRLSYCNITAPIDGFIAQKRIQKGDRIQPGQILMAVVPLEGVYVEANYKETQLTHVRIGQLVDIEADIYPGYTFRGKVAGIRAGTGAAFSLLPPENATGNWIKVVQRVPVKIRLDQVPPSDHPLRVGLSLIVTIHTEDRSGPMLMKVPEESPPKP
ncbi:MAG: HlyD family secretion protein [Syntrophaceae bacterium]|nr:HlyD family secretion protein [Syntrophaceae bacterium]